jgi:hypothetical protein
MSLLLSFFGTLVEIFVFEFFVIFLLEDELVIAGFDDGGFLFMAPVNLYIAFFCFYL